MSSEVSCTLAQSGLLWKMVNNTELARDALLGLEETQLRCTALAMLYVRSHGAELRNLALGLRNTDALAGAVKVFVSWHQSGVLLFP